MMLLAAATLALGALALGARAGTPQPPATVTFATLMGHRLHAGAGMVNMPSVAGQLTVTLESDHEFDIHSQFHLCLKQFVPPSTYSDDGWKSSCQALIDFHSGETPPPTMSPTTSPTVAPVPAPGPSSSSSSGAAPAPSSSSDAAPAPSSSSDDAPPAPSSSDAVPAPSSSSDDVPPAPSSSDDVPPAPSSSDDVPPAPSSSDDAPPAPSSSDAARKRFVAGGVAQPDWAEQKAVVRAGAYHAAIAYESDQHSNITFTLTFQWSACNATAGEFGDDCAQSGMMINSLAPFADQRSGMHQFYYVFTPQLTNRTLLEVTVKPVDENSTAADAYARWGSTPAVSIGADGGATVVADAHSNADGALIVELPQPNTQWTLAVVAANSSVDAPSYNVTAAFRNCMPGDDDGNPHCPPDAEDAPSGPGGASKVVPVSRDTVAYFRAPAGASVNMAFAPLSNDASRMAPHVYARFGAMPVVAAADEGVAGAAHATGVWDYQDCTSSALPCSTDLHIIAATADGAGADDQHWYFAVQGQGDGMYNAVMWDAGSNNTCADQCLGRGMCDNYRCSCDAGTIAPRCDPDDAMQPWEWALIIGGGVLVAIGLVGCVVYFIQRQQRRSGFDRV